MRARVDAALTLDAREVPAFGAAGEASGEDISKLSQAEAIQKIATAMGLATVAEYVESEDIAKKLDCTPSIVWRWQKKLGVKKGRR